MLKCTLKFLFFLHPDVDTDHLTLTPLKSGVLPINMDRVCAILHTLVFSVCLESVLFINNHYGPGVCNTSHSRLHTACYSLSLSI